VLELVGLRGAPTDVRAADVHVRLAHALECSGQRAAALQEFERGAELAQLAGARESFARAVLGRFEIQRDVAMLDDFVRRGVTEALAHCDGDDELRARLLAADAFANGMVRSLPERRAMLDEALAIARTLGDPATLTAVLSCVHRTVLESTTPELLALANEMTRAAEQARLPDQLMDGYLWRITYLMRLGRVLAQEVDLCEHERLARVHCDSFHQWHSVAARAAYHAMGGELGAAEATMHTAYELGSRLDPFLAEAVKGTQLFMIALQSEGTARVRLFRDAHQLATKILAFIPWFRTWAALVARSADELGQGEDNANQLAPLVEEAQQEPLGTMHRLTSLSVLTPLVCEHSNPDLASKVYESMQPFAGLSICVNHGTYFGQVNDSLAALAARLGHSDRAREHAHAARVELSRLRAGHAQRKAS
jgi:hypothetical protein